MSTSELEAMFSVTEKPSRSTDGTATVITEEMCLGLIEVLSGVKVGQEVRLTAFPRNTRGSAAGFGYQVKKALQEKYGDALTAAGITGGVKSGARPQSKDQADDVKPWFAAISRG